MIQEESIEVQYMKWNIGILDQHRKLTYLDKDTNQVELHLTTLHDQVLNSETYFVQPLLFIKNVSGISNCRV